MGKPYVISAELDLVSARLSEIVEPSNIELFRESLDEDLKAMGKETYWVSSGMVQSGLERVISRTQMPVVSLDDRYVTNADEYLGISRGVDLRLRDIGYVARRGYEAIETQLSSMTRVGSEVLLVDDVLFSGEMIAWLDEIMKPYGVQIGAVAVGIAITEGIEKLQARGIDVVAQVVFDEVDDEICERDFAIVPGSGRRIEKLQMNALYFDIINGKPEQWASISPEACESFCINSLQRSTDLLKSGVCMDSLGRFLGYSQTGSAKDAIRQRLK